MATSEEVMSMKNAGKFNKAAAAKPAAAEASPKKDEEPVVTTSDLQAMMDELKRLRMENDEFKKRQKPITFSVNDRGAVAIHGIGKYPFSLYRSQWERIFENADGLRSFIKEHEIELN